MSSTAIEDHGTGVIPSTQLIDFIHNISSLFHAVPTKSTNFYDTVDNHSLCDSFIKSSNASTLYIVVKPVDTAPDTEPSFEYLLTEELKNDASYTSIVALIKSNDPIYSGRSLHSQLHILNIPTESQAHVDNTSGSSNGDTNGNSSSNVVTDVTAAATPLTSTRKFEMMRSLLTLGISPYFELITSTEQFNSDSVSIAKKKFNELSLTLQHLQQKIHTPDLLSSAHPILVKFIEENGKERDNDIEQLLPISDTSFLNQLTAIVNGWVKQIQSITRLNHNPRDGSSIIEEVLFWKSMDESLHSLNQQLTSREVQLSIETLKRAKRYHITMSFTNEIGLESKLAETQNFNSILKDFPVDELLSCDINALPKSINGVFNHLKKLKNFQSYPLVRSIELVEVVLKDITNKFIESLSSVFLMSLPIDEFLKFYNTKISEIFQVIDTNVKTMVNLIRELLRKRQEKFIMIKVNQDDLDVWKNRLEYLKAFRIRHNDLIKTCEILQESDEKLVEGYNQYIIPVNICDNSVGGLNVWKSNENLYLNVYDEYKKVCVQNINNLFDSCTNFNEFISLYKRLNGEKFTEHSKTSSSDFILSFINEEHKLRCMTIVDDEVQRMLTRYRKSTTEMINSLQVYDKQPQNSILGKTTWLISINKSANFYLSNLKALFGENWDQYSVGSKISGEIKGLLKVSNPADIINEWISSIEFDFDLGSQIFKVVTTSNGNTDPKLVDFSEFSLVVNFNRSNLQLADQLNQLKNLGFKVPSQIQAKLNTIDKLYPIVRDLTEYMNILEDILVRELQQTTYGKRFGFLIESSKIQVFELIKECYQIEWNSLSQAVDLQKIETNEQDLSNLLESKSLLSLKSLLEQIYVLYSKTSSIRKFSASFHEELDALMGCAYNKVSISEKLAQISDLANKFCYEDFDDVSNLYESINMAIEKVLTNKCVEELEKYSSRLRGEAKQTKLVPNDATTISLNFQDQSFTLSPDIRSCKKAWLEEVNSLISIVSSNFLINFSDEKQFTSISEVISPQVSVCLSEIDEVTDGTTRYLNKWTELQKLWETNPASLEESLGDKEPHTWIDKILSIRKSRLLFDTTDTQVAIVPNFLYVDYSSVQMRIFSKFDDWQSEVLLRFSLVLQAKMKTMDSTLKEAINTLKQDIDFSLTGKIIEIIVKTYTFQEGINQEWTDLLSTIQAGQSLLEKSRFKFPKDWLYVEQVENHLVEVTSLTSRKTKSISEHIDMIQPRLFNESRRIDDIIKQLNQSWQERKPISGELVPSKAIQILHEFEKSCNDIDFQETNLSKALHSLGLDSVTQEHKSGNLKDTTEEIKDLLSVWVSLDGLWESIQLLRALSWNETSPRSLRRQLDDVSAQARAIPSKTRQYSAYNTIQELIKTHIRNHSLVTELKSSAMKARHWKILYKSLNMSVPGPADDDATTSLTVGMVWDMNLSIHEQLIKSILNQASMEQTLEENIEKISETWNLVAFETFNYSNNKCRLIKGWDKLFDQCNSDLSSLSNMKNAAFYSSFEQQATILERKLNTLYLLLDIWVDVQREWVYLDGVFGNGDISNLLPLEYNRFNNISHEFFAVIKNTSKYPLVIDVLSIPDIQKVMEKILESLNKVRKSLSDYLEMQRDLFPRFYFIGNEDLLQIIGSANGSSSSSSNITSNINQHLRKMFSGIANIEYATESSTITGIYGDLGEYIKLMSPISLIKFPRLNEWLKRLEVEVRFTLSNLTEDAISKLKSLLDLQTSDIDDSELSAFIDNFPCQVVILAFQVVFTSLVEASISNSQLSSCLSKFLSVIKSLTKKITLGMTSIQKKKRETLIIELLHQRDILTMLIGAGDSKTEVDFLWNVQQQYLFDSKHPDPLSRLKVKQAQVEFVYGFEYLGIPDKLAYTPLTNKCFLSLTQALGQKLGGSPFGPAGTGKTESVKALGQNLGKMVLVFNCDDSFDFMSMGRIFLGLCKVGCWGCFDEFNRLDEKILSAVSSQIESIELGLSTESREIDLSDKMVTVHSETGIFITMNPGYAGRSELPENLKKLFRSVSMEKPDMEIIIEVLLTSSGFSKGKELSSIIVPFFEDIIKNTSKQVHYDFGLRALKSTLVACGSIKRFQSQFQNEDADVLVDETKIVLRSIKETIYPKLIIEDELVLDKIIEKYFPGLLYELDDYELINRLELYASQHGLNPSTAWITKALQLYRIQKTNHGIMLVGETGSGKSTIWKSLLKVLSIKDGLEDGNITFTIDSKVLPKDKIFGTLDLITREWVDGLFTSILRRVSANLRGEMSKRIWIVFDGDIDPEWAENLNSVLDDNRILTLPNGERLSLPDNVKILFEVDSLKSTTPATVSRCGMVWFDKSLISLDALYKALLHRFVEGNRSEDKTVFATIISKTMSSNVLSEVVAEASKLTHVMSFNLHRYLETLFALLSTYYTHYSVFKSFDTDGIETSDNSNFKMYAIKSLVLSLIWSFSGDCCLAEREAFGDYIIKLACFNEVDRIDSDKTNYIDYYCSYPDAKWYSWLSEVDEIGLEPHQVSDSNTVVPTLDTVRHENLIYTMLNEHRPFLLCGPPGSGKTMILLEALRKSPDLDILSLNFSKDTTPDLLMKSLHQFCEYKKSSSTGLTLAPKVNGKWVVVFCDEINLPGYDKYGTQRVISLLRQMIEQGGFWRAQDKQWVTLNNIQFVGACNPPTDPGRNPLPERFLRHTSLIMVDYPGEISLNQIYSTYNSAVMKCASNLRGYNKVITESMIEVYSRTKVELGPNIEQHYVYSPRELTRWSKGLLEGLKSHTYNDLEEFVRLWYHEGLRLFYDRLVNEKDKQWTLKLFRDTILNNFPHMNVDEVTNSPVLFSNWLSSDYENVSSKSELMSFISERLRVFSEEEIDVADDIVLYDAMLDHALRIDRVLRQPQGHMILVGPSTSGKSTLSRFVAWINGLNVVQLNVNTGYTLLDFDLTLRSILLRCAAGEKICFIIDENSVLETSFIERMNTLLANAEIPGLFEDDNFSSLMKLCQSESQQQGLFLDTDDELYKWFTQQVGLNLHVIFSISDTNSANRPKITTSPALFNRCVLSWMGDWSNDSLFEIATRLVSNVPLDLSNYNIPVTFEKSTGNDVFDLRGVIVDILIHIHRSAQKSPLPASFIRLIGSFVETFGQKLFEIEDNQRHINTGLDKLKETVLQVNQLKAELSEKEKVLIEKDNEAKVMLNKMLTDQNEAERKQEFSIETQSELSKQQAEIEKRRARVMKDLELAEPAVLEAQRGVQNIKKQHLTEIRSMSNPPNAVKLTMESVCILIGYEVNSWRDVQSIVRRDDFIANIVSFDNESQLTQELRTYMNEKYLSRPDFNFEAVNRASKACGPLLQWVLAQLTYSTILDNIGPLRQEMMILEESTSKTKAQLIAIDQMIHELEEKIETYKDEYSQLIRDAENVKSDIKSVQQKVDRSLTLIDNLTLERERWSAGVKKFAEERELLIGDSILASSFITYCGGLDERGRESMIAAWKLKMKTSGIKFDTILNISSYLVSSKEILEIEEASSTSSNSLSSGTLDIENFVIMKKSYIPLIIDPPSTIITALSNMVKSSGKGNRKLMVTSFLNSNYLQQLENALRFGGVILIQDAEHYDPILNTILKKETIKNGGRTVVKLRDQEIDYSPDFKLYLHTTDPSIEVSSFIAGRTSIVNFTITSSSLENQILNITLSKRRPDIEERRREIIELQSQYKFRLHSLEEKLLVSLSEEKGKNILEDDNLVTTLETLKAESYAIDEKMSDSLRVMESVDEVRARYFGIAKHCSSIFELLRAMKKLNRFYDCSLSSFTNIYKWALSGNSDHGDSNDVLVKRIYQETFARVSISYRQQDKIVFALLLVLSYYLHDIGDRFKDCLLLILESIAEKSNHTETLDEIFKVNLIDRREDFSIDKVYEENPNNDTINHLSHFLKYMAGEVNEEIGNIFAKFASFLFSGVGAYSSRYDLGSILDLDEDNIDSPIVLVSPDGFDPTFKVQQLSEKLSKNLSIISMGVKEGTDLANKEINKAIKSGSWVMIQNVQLSGSNWLNLLEKKLQSTSSANGFKLFLTCNTASKSTPSATLLHKSLKVMFENQLGIQNRTKELYDSIPRVQLSANPGERKHLYFLLVWFHCMVLERLRYVPIAFHERYDITISDFNAGKYVIDKYLESFGTSRTNISPDLIPWESIRFMVADITYGSKIHNQEDFDYIVEYSRKLFKVESFNIGFNLIENGYTVKSGTVLSPPEGGSGSDGQRIYQEWITKSLPEEIPLNWIGLDEEVDVLIEQGASKRIAAEVYKLAKDL